ncbi:MAG: 50S ribosomal protein L32e [Candidatus Lokiarchaeota archaeon]|nr:50S ribosomal protein L32e [Candidatus Lokiarchaeota archaeon]
MNEKDRLLRLREEKKKKRPTFKRYESWRYKRVSPSWRKAQGIDSKVRRKKKGIIKSPNIGYRGPKKVRGLHPTGLEEVLIHNIQDLDKIDKKNQIIKISSTIGIKKRRIILELADQKRILVSNPGKMVVEEKLPFSADYKVALEEEKEEENEVQDDES